MQRDVKEEKLRHSSVADSDGGVADGAQVPLQGPENHGGSGVLETAGGGGATARQRPLQSRVQDALGETAAAAGAAVDTAAKNVVSAAQQSLERRDPVCGKVVLLSKGLEAEYAGLTYYFDSQECLKRFNQEPDLFTLSPGKGNIADNDRTLRGEAQDRKGEMGPTARPKLEQPRTESGGG